MTPYDRFLIALLFLWVLCVKTNGRSLSIGAILDTNSRIGREEKISIDVAIRRFNSSDVAITFNAIHLRNNSPRQAASYAHRLIQRGTEVIISSGTWPQVLSISDVGEQLKVPIVSLTPSSFVRKPYLVQMSYPESALVSCLADFVKSYKWYRVIMVYEDDDYGTISGTAQLLAYALQQVGTLLDYTAVFPSMVSLPDPTSIIRSELDRMRQHLSTVYIVLRSSENLTLSLFREASTYGMMNKGSVWICGPDVTTLLDSILNASFISNHMEGIIGVEPYIKESEPEYNRFYSEFRQSFRSEYEKRGETNFNPGIYAVRAFDGLYAITVAANRSSMNGPSLMDNLEVSNFTGLSGLVMPGINEKFDVAIGDITITSSRSENVSFTEPYIGSGLTTVVPLKERGVDIWLVIRPFHWKLWVTFLALLIGTFGIIWGLEKFDSCNSADNQDPWYKQLEATFWVVGNTLFQNTGEGICHKKNVDKRELSFYTKVITIAWLLVILIVSNCFTANLSSILVTEKLKPDVNKSIAGCQNVSFVVSYVERVLKFKPENIVPINVPEEVAIAFDKKAITIAIMELPYARIFLSKHKKYAVHGETQMLGGFGFALQKNDPLTAQFSRAILELQEDGTVKNLESQWFSSFLSESESAANNTDDRQSLRLAAISIIFIFYGGITAITLFFFFAQKYRKSQNGHRQHGSSKSQNGEVQQGSSGSQNIQGHHGPRSNQNGEGEQGAENGEILQMSLNTQNGEGQQGASSTQDSGGQQVPLGTQDGGGQQVPSGTQDGGGQQVPNSGPYRRTRSISTVSQTESRN